MLARSLVSITLSVLMLVGTTAATAAPQAAVSTCDTPEGEVYFAAELNSGIPPDPARGCDVVVLFETSESQVGAYRSHAITALNSFLRSLGPKDRVKLVAVDLDATNLTEDFVAPSGMEMRLAKEKLARRIPLGSTDMAAVLSAATSAFTSAGSNHRAAVYVGDGITRANMLTASQFSEACRALVERRIPFYSCIVGPSHGRQFAAALANHTGGMFCSAAADASSASQAGQKLSSWVHGSVAWPTAAVFSTGIKEVLPRSVPPLRGDRDTLLIGKLADRRPQAIDLTVEAAGKTRQLKFDLLPGRSNADAAFVPRLAELVRADGRMSMATPGTESLAEVGGMLLQDSEVLRKLDARAQNVAAANAGRNASLSLGSPASGVLGELRSRPEPSLLDAVAERDRVVRQQMELVVQKGLEDARRKMGVDSAAAVEKLRRLLEQVEQSPRLESAVRQRLRASLETTIRTASRMAAAEAASRVAEQERVAAVAENQQINRQRLSDDEQLRELSARYRSLVNEGRYAEAENLAANFRRMDPDDPAAEAMVWWSRNRGYVTQIAALRDLKQRMFVDALYQVERSSVPFPDDRPIVYPDPAVWQALTQRRSRYAPMDFSNGGAGQRILDELERQAASAPR